MYEDDFTFLLTDIEGSTRLWNQHPDAMLAAVAAHNELLTAVVESHRGTVFKDTGDGMWASFQDATDAVACSVQAQINLASHPWGSIGDVRVRMSLHRGFTLRRVSDHCGQTINLTARLNGLAHGGQVLVTQAVVDATDQKASEERSISFADLGEHQLRDLPDPVRIHQVLHPALPTETRLVVDASEVRKPLAEPLRTLRGREGDVIAVTEMLERSRLVTVTGAAGVGKTRLAVRVANLLRHRFLSGCVLVESRATDPEGLLLDVAAALGIYRQTSEPLVAIISEFLAVRPALLVVDGLETASEDARRTLAQLAEQCADSWFILTSTEVLGLREGQRYVLEPLSFQASESTPPPAVELLIDAALDHGAALGEVDESILIELCAAVDGLPLAIELLSAHLAVQNPRTVLDELTNIDMTGPLRAVLRDAIQRLPADEKIVLEELCCFSGPFTLPTAVHVCPRLEAAPHEAGVLLESLLGHSLLSHALHDASDVWFRVLEPVRRFVLETLGSERVGELNERHASQMVTQARSWTQSVRGRGELEWAERIEGHFGEIAASFEWSLQHDQPEVASEIVSTMWDFAHGRMRPDVWGWAEEIVTVMEPALPTAEVLGVAALGAWMRADGDAALRLVDLAISQEEAQGEPPSVPARLALLDAHSYATDQVSTDPLDLSWAFLDLFKSSSIDEPYWLVNAHVVGAVGLSFLEQTTEAQNLAEEALRIGRDAHNPSTHAWALFGAAMAFESRDEPLAEAYADEAVRIARTVGNVWIESIATGLLVTLRRRVAGGRAAVPLLLDLLATWERTAHAAQQWHAVRASGFALLQDGEHEGGLELITAAERATTAMPLLPSERREVAAALSSADDEIADTPKARAVARGRVLDLGRATALARHGLAGLAEQGS